MEIILPLFYLCFENPVNNAIVVPGSLMYKALKQIAKSVIQ